jgi:hypothetical protein
MNSRSFTAANAPFLNCTKPAGLAPPLKVAVKVTLWPWRDGLELEPTETLVAAWFTVCVMPSEVLLAFAAVFSKIQPMVFGETTAKRLPHRPAMIPVFVHLLLVLMLGLWIPPALADWYREAARLIG